MVKYHFGSLFGCVGVRQRMSSRFHGSKSWLIFQQFDNGRRQGASLYFTISKNDGGTLGCQCLSVSSLMVSRSTRQGHAHCCNTNCAEFGNSQSTGSGYG
jgi:hypothetical protein